MPAGHPRSQCTNAQRKAPSKRPSASCSANRKPPCFLPRRERRASAPESWPEIKGRSSPTKARASPRATLASARKRSGGRLSSVPRTDRATRRALSKHHLLRVEGQGPFPVRSHWIEVGKAMARARPSNRICARWSKQQVAERAPCCTNRARKLALASAASVDSASVA